MNLTLTKLFRSSFRGAEFLIEVSELTEGRKTVIHEYPNSPNRFVEDLNELPAAFTITGMISGPNYLTKRDNLRAALRQPGIGQLVHPYFGTIDVTPQPYTLVESITPLNEARFTMPFLRSSPPVLPKIAENNISTIRQLQTRLIELARLDIIDQFEVTRTFRNNYQDAVGLLATINSGFEDVVRLFTSDPISNSNLLREVTRFSNNLGSLPSSPTATADGITDLFTLANDVAETPEEGVELYKAFFNFGEDDVPFKLNTTKRIERQKNRDVLNNATNLLALIFAYANAVRVDYSTDEQLLEQKEALEVQAQVLLQDNANNIFSNETIQRLKQLRVQVNEFFKQTLLTVDKIRTINIKEPTPITVLTYLLYGDLENAAILIDLNTIQNPGFVVGDLRILASANQS